MTDAAHMITVMLGYEDFEKNTEILDVVWTILRDISVKYPYMILRDGKKAHWHWDPIKLEENGDDLVRIWEFNIDIQGMVKTERTFFDCIDYISRAVKPLTATFTIHSYDGTGERKSWVGPNENSEKYRDMLSELYSAVWRVAAWKDHDSTGEYKKNMAGTKLEKRIMKLWQMLEKMDNI